MPYHSKRRLQRPRNRRLFLQLARSTIQIVKPVSNQIS
jgi:hypothetical protein